MMAQSLQLNFKAAADVQISRLASFSSARTLTATGHPQNIRHVRCKVPSRDSRITQYRKPFSVLQVKASSTAASPPRRAGDGSKDVTGLVELLHKAATDRSIPPKQVCAAMIQIEKHKLPTDGWAQTLGGDASPGWRLVFTTGTKQVQEAVKGGAGGGRYIPINAVQRWNDETKVIENGIYLGHIASLKLTGPWAMNKKKMDFDFDRISIKLGPWKFGLNLKPRQMDDTFRKEAAKGAGPFFLFCYVDDRICVARGRGGGLALWSCTTPVWEAEAGITQA
ncbi:hypothetical protein ABBQ32_007320 [Trebouxia sp. C0010 RCD-2024]